MSPGVWRLLQEAPADGAANMARDEALLRSAEHGAPPTLRLYAWIRPTLSLGAHQPSRDADIPACRRLGVDLVRRPTGGGAVLHDAELTYAVIGRLGEDPFPSSVVALYEMIAEALVAGLARLGVRAEAREDPSRSEPARSVTGAFPGRGDPRSDGAGTGPAIPADCFAVASRREILAGGRKLIGSAQLRRRRAFLQHGSILIEGDGRLLPQVLPALRARMPPGGSTLRDETVAPITLWETRGKRTTRSEVEEAICEGFREIFGAVLRPGALDLAEAEHEVRLRAFKYLDALWTLEGKLRADSLT